MSADDLDEGTDDNAKYKSLMHGAQPTVKHCGSFKAEIKAIAEFVSMSTVGPVLTGDPQGDGMTMLGELCA
ncbi:MAG: hypothetical protein RL701_6194 [Pseudomonadota bacterium]